VNFSAVCGVTVDRQIYCWGHNQSSQIGIGVKNTSTYAKPQRVKSMATFRQVSVGWDHVCALDLESKLYCWGIGYFFDDPFLQPDGALRLLVPTPLFPDVEFAQISAGTWFTCGLTPENRAVCWGINQSGQLGTDTEELSLTTPHTIAKAHT
jgi:alpha-tubulin suppressor-like RCC1 family protein